MAKELTLHLQNCQNLTTHHNSRETFSIIRKL